MLKLPDRAGNFYERSVILEYGGVAVRKKLRRILQYWGTTALIFTITACGNRMDAMQPDSSYVADFFDIPDSVTGIERLLLKDDMAYMCCLEEDGTSYLAAMNIDDGKF